MKKKYSLTAVLALCSLVVFGQGAKNIKINSGGVTNGPPTAVLSRRNQDP